MANYPTILQQFRSFCFRNNATDIGTAIDYFAVFGGMGWNINLSIPIETVIEEKILNNYKFIHAEVTAITQSNRDYHQLLTALATGDRREHSAFKNTRMGRKDGEYAIDFLVEAEILETEVSQETPLDGKVEISDKLMFVHPFMRFWFSSISPYYKGIKEGEFSEFKERWNNIKHGFSDLIIEQLVMDLIRTNFKDDPLENIGSYWDKSIEIDILAKTKSGKRIAGICKYSKAKAGKTELKKLKEKCKKAGFNIEMFIVFSKNKFSNELKKEKSNEVKLISIRNLKVLIEDLDIRDILTTTNKKY
jgi:uncharacterized protein